MKKYIFPKFLQKLSQDEMFDFCKEVGLDGPTAMIREGFWITDETIETALPKYVKEANVKGLEVAYADTDFPILAPEQTEKYLPILKDCGITQYRLWYLTVQEHKSRDLPDVFEKAIAKHAALAEKYGLQVIVQLHGGGYYPHNATTAYNGIKNLDPRYVGIKVDPGNNANQEGTERPLYQVELLQEYIAAIGIKDTAFFPNTDKKGYYKAFVPCGEGVNDYKEYLSEMKKYNFKGPGIFMPFYEENDVSVLKTKLLGEIEYIKKIEAEI